MSDDRQAGSSEHSQGLSDPPESHSKNQAGSEGFPQRPSPKAQDLHMIINHYDYFDYKHKKSPFMGDSFQEIGVTYVIIK